MMQSLLAAGMLCIAASIAHADIASCYGTEGGQTRTATGAHYNPWGLTAAHRTLRFGTRVKVTNLRNGRSVIVTINDRGPAAWTHRTIDLSLGSCAAIGLSLGKVSLEIVGGPS